jgi:hypothetical protein
MAVNNVTGAVIGTCCVLCGACHIFFLSYALSLQVRVKMVTADDEATTDIIVEGDREEITRLSKVRLAMTAVHLTASSSKSYVSGSADSTLCTRLRRTATLLSHAACRWDPVTPKWVACAASGDHLTCTYFAAAHLAAAAAAAGAGAC